MKPPLIEAQREELRSRFESYRVGARQARVPGEFVRLRHGLGVLNAEARGTMALMFWRWLDAGEAYDRILLRDIAKNGLRSFSTVFAKVDCVVAMMTDDGASVGFWLFDSATLERDEAAA